MARSANRGMSLSYYVCSSLTLLRESSSGATRLSFSSIESGEFNFESRAHVDGEAQKRSNKNLGEGDDGRKGKENHK